LRRIEEIMKRNNVSLFNDKFSSDSDDDDDLDYWFNLYFIKNKRNYYVFVLYLIIYINLDINEKSYTSCNYVDHNS